RGRTTGPRRPGRRRADRGGARRLTRRLLLLLCAACAAGPRAREGPPAAIVGPVTCLASLDGQLVACSQAGLALVEGSALRPLVDPGFRVLAVADAGDCWIAVGGIPGEAGIAARIRDGRVIARRR